jgi:4-hydroxybenzoate polyprenyltransferase
MIYFSTFETYSLSNTQVSNSGSYAVDIPPILVVLFYILPVLLFAVHLVLQIITLDLNNAKSTLAKFKSNFWAGLLLVISFGFFH